MIYNYKIEFIASHGHIAFIISSEKLQFLRNFEEEILTIFKSIDENQNEVVELLQYYDQPMQNRVVA